MSIFKGSMVAIVTPMNEDGTLDFASLKNLIEFHIQNQTDVIISVGTTGESATLDFDEHSQVIKKTIELVKGRIPVIAGTGANSTLEAIELTKSAKSNGADGCLLVTPYYNKPTQEGLYISITQKLLTRLIFHKYYIMFPEERLLICNLRPFYDYQRTRI